MTNKDRYKKLFEELVENYFSNEKFIQQREALENENLDDEYKAYVLEKFKSRTPEGWFKYIANKERTSSIVNIKNENLPPEIEVMNLKRVNDTKFEETQPGIETKLNIEVFENLYFISNRRSNKKEKEKQIKEFPSFKYRIAEIKKYLTDLETTEDKSEYLLFLKKELEKVIYAFENTVLRKYSKENNNLNFNKASELAKFIEDLREVREIESCEELNSIINGMLEDLGAYFERTDYYKKYYYKLAGFKIEVTTEVVDDYVGCGVMDINEKIVKELKILT